MKTKTSLLLPMLAVLLAFNFAGCDSSGPLTRAVTLSNLKTFEMVSGFKKDATQAPTEAPATDMLAQAVRDEIASKGYQYQSTSPDFLVSTGWVPSEKLEQSDLAGPPDVKVDMVTLSIIVRDRVTNETLWSNPSSMPVANGTITGDGARGMIQRALKDFPPSQAGK